MDVTELIMSKWSITECFWNWVNKMFAPTLELLDLQSNFVVNITDLILRKKIITTGWAGPSWASRWKLEQGKVGSQSLSAPSVTICPKPRVIKIILKEHIFPNVACLKLLQQAMKKSYTYQVIIFVLFCFLDTYKHIIHYPQFIWNWNISEISVYFKIHFILQIYL